MMGNVDIETLNALYENLAHDEEGVKKKNIKGITRAEWD